MKLKLACASLLVLSACGPSREAMGALQQMQILQNDPNAQLSYRAISGSGNDVTLSDVEVRFGAGMLAMMAGGEEGEDAGEDHEGHDAPAALDLTEPAPGPVTVAKAGSMTLRGLTLKDGKPVMRDLVLNGLAPAVPMDGATVNFGSLSFEGMNEVTGQYIASAFTKEGAGEPPAFEQWGFAKAGIGAMTLAIPIPQEEGTAGKMNIQLGEFSFSDLKDKTIGLAKLDGLKGDLDIPGMLPVVGTFDLGRLELGGIHTDTLAGAFMQGWNAEMNPGAPADYGAMYKDYTSPLDGGVDRVFWDGAKADFSGLKFSLNGLNSTLKRNAEGVAVGIDFPRTTFKLTADSSGGSLGAMGRMVMAMGGYDSNVIEAYLAGAASFDPAKDITRWDNYNLGVTDAFDVKVSLGVEGLQKALPGLLTALSQLQTTATVESEVVILDEDEGEEDSDEDSDEAELDAGADPDDNIIPDFVFPEDAEDDEDQDSGKTNGGLFGGGNQQAMGALVLGLLPLQLTDLDLSITDQKVVDMILERQAIEAGQTADALRGDLVMMLAGSAVFMKDAGIDAAIADELSAAASGFMAGPGTLRIQLKPKQPLGVMSAMLMPITKDSLGFSATFVPLAKAN